MHPSLQRQGLVARVSARRRELLSFVVCASVCWIVIFWRLGYASLLDPDEAHYAELTREMVRARSWFVPLLDGAPYIDKPVLFHWLQGLFVQAFGESEIAMRLPAALAAVALIWITRWVGTKLFDRTVGDWGAMMFATIPATFLLSSLGLFDMLFAAFLFGGLSCLLVAGVEARERLAYTGWVLLTLAVMTKGPVAIVLVAVFFLTCVLLSARTRALARVLHWPSGLLLVALAAAPWFVWMWGKFGDEFLRGYVFAGNLWYLTSVRSFSGRQTSYAFYLYTMSGAFFPWSLVLFGYAADTVAHWREGRARPIGEALLWMWTLTVVGFFSLAGFKLDTYIFPAAPACCLLAARAWQSATADAAQRATRVAVVAIGVLLLAMGVVAGLVLFDLNLGLDRTALVLPVVLGTGGLAILWLTTRNGWLPPNPLGAPLVTMLAVYAAFVLVGLPVLERSRPTAPIGRWIQRSASTEARVGTYGVGDWRASIRYYTDRYVAELPTTGDVESFLEGSPHSYVIMLRRDYRSLRERGLDVKVVFGRPMIAGRSSGRYIRRQIWDELVVVADRSSSLAAVAP